MAKRKAKKSKVYYNSDTDTWSDDAAEQPYLMPGTKAYKQYVEKLEAAKSDAPDDEFHEELEKNNEDYRDDQLEKEYVEEVHHVGKRKYRKYMSKDVQTKETKRIAEAALGHRVSKSDFDDELYDDSIDASEYKSEVLKDYKEEFDDKREIPVLASVEDDSEEYEMTPGMKKMAKYM